MRYGFTMPRLDGTVVSIDVPGPDQRGESAEELFEEACKEVAAELNARDRAKAEKRVWSQSVCYPFLSYMIAYGHGTMFEERISRLGRDPRGSIHVNPFQRGLLAAFAHEPGLMDEGDREYFGKRLWYAFRHYVPPCFLMGFLHEVWSNDAERRASSGFIEPQFEQWIWRERAGDPYPDLRGAYPAQLEAKVHQFRQIGPLIAAHSERLQHDRTNRDKFFAEE